MTTAVRQLEKLCIANYCDILCLCKDIPGRKYDTNEFIKTLSKVEVILKDKDKDAKAKRRMEQACTEEEGTMADLIDELFESANRSAEESQNEATISLEFDMSGDDIASGRTRDEFEDIIHDDDNELIEEANDTANEVTANEVTDSVIVGSSGKNVKASLATVNDLCFVDIMTVGREMMERANPMMTQFKKKKRVERMVDFYEKIFDKCTKNLGDDVIDCMFERFKNQID